MSDPKLLHVEYSKKKKLSSFRADILCLDRIHDSTPVPYLRHKDVRIICIDCEAWERDSRCVTEVGIAILDTRKIEVDPPGETGRNWQRHIEAKHFLIDEYMDKTNSEFVTSYPMGFGYGESEIVRLNEMKFVLQDIFAVHSDEPVDSSGLKGFRDVVFLAHNAFADIKLLRNVGFDVAKFETVKEIIDTQAMWSAINAPSEAQANIKLKSLLEKLEVPYASEMLHNAGNDAYFTLQAFIAITLLEGTMRSVSSRPNEADYPLQSIEGLSEEEKAERVRELLKWKEERRKARLSEQDELANAISKLYLEVNGGVTPIEPGL